MSAINEQIVREYFELLGYLAIQPSKHIGKVLSPENEIDLIVYNPNITEHKLPKETLWDNSHLKTIKQAVIKIIGTHTTRFYPANLMQLPELVQFASPSSTKWAISKLNVKEIAKVLCVSQLPVNPTLRNQTLEMLKSKGIDGVITFKTILITLIGLVDLNKNYEKSDVLQVIRLIKNYDLIKTPDMRLFTKKHKILKSPKQQNLEDNKT